MSRQKNCNHHSITVDLELDRELFNRLSLANLESPIVVSYSSLIGKHLEKALKIPLSEVMQ